jgi:nucleotide-binding universal stress UspA family protein
MYKRILLSLDGSALAEQALPHAVAQAEHFHAELILLKVLEPLAKSHNISLDAAERVEKATHELAREYLESIAAGVRGRGISVRVVTVSGNPHEGIVSCAEAEQADLIVISTRGHSGLSRWLIGSVADRVVRGARVPVLLVSARQEEAASTESLERTP